MMCFELAILCFWLPNYNISFKIVSETSKKLLLQLHVFFFKKLENSKIIQNLAYFAGSWSWFNSWHHVQSPTPELSGVISKHKSRSCPWGLQGMARSLPPPLRKLLAQQICSKQCIFVLQVLRRDDSNWKVLTDYIVSHCSVSAKGMEGEKTVVPSNSTCISCY